jgi:hypothetical protein
MALMLPLLLLVLFGIIDLGYYIYGYSTIYHAARNGTERAANLGPYTTRLNDPNEPCMRAIMNETLRHVSLFSDFTTGNVQVSYPQTRALGQPIQVQLTYNIRPLTPLFQLVAFGNRGVMPVQIAARRSIENLGSGPISTNDPNGIVCDQ